MKNLLLSIISGMDKITNLRKRKFLDGIERIYIKSK